MDFSSITIGIELNNFIYAIPSGVKNFKAKSEDENPKKKKKTGGKRVENDNMVKEWKLRPGEAFETIFKHKVKNGPTLSLGCKGCHKFHNKGYCFDDCMHAKSHCKLNKEDAKLFGNYCKVCRGE